MTLTRRYVERTRVPRSFFNPINGNFYSEVSKKHRLGEGSTLLQAVEVCDTPMLYLMPMPKGTYHNPTSIYPAKADWEKSEVRVHAWYGDNAGIIEHRGRKVSINALSRWFDVRIGDTLSDTILATHMLEKLLNEHLPINGHTCPIYLQETPTRTAMDLVRRKLPYGAKYEALPSDIEAILMKNFSQQRNELISHGYDTATDVHLYDGRFMYASCLRNVPVGAILHDTTDKYLPYVAGFYRVKARVPDNWQHIGLLPCKNTASHNQQQGSTYPRIPGTVFESWCSDRELRLALDYRWECKIQERILWPQTQVRKKEVGEEVYKSLGQDPLRYFGEGLTTIRQTMLPTLELPTRQKELIGEGLRNLLMHGVGGMHASEKYQDREVTDLRFLPDEIPFENVFETGDGTYRYKEPKTKTEWEQEQFQPHWIQYLYCDCKTKVTKFVVEYIPFEQCLAIRTDGVWTLGPCDVPSDSGKVGVFREKSLSKRGPFPYPTNNKAIEKLMRTAKEGE